MYCNRESDTTTHKACSHGRQASTQPSPTRCSLLRLLLLQRLVFLSAKSRFTCALMFFLFFFLFFFEKWDWLSPWAVFFPLSSVHAHNVQNLVDIDIFCSVLHALTRLPCPPMLRLASGFRDWLIFHVRQSCVGGIQTIHSCSLRCGLCATADSRTAAANVTGQRLFPVPQVHCCCAESRKRSLNHTAGASRRYPQYCPLRKILLFFFFKSVTICGSWSRLCFPKTHSQVHLDSWQSRPVPVRGPGPGEGRWGEVNTRKAGARKRGRQDESQEWFDFHPLHYLWDSFQRWGWDEWCACVRVCAFCVFMRACCGPAGQA